MEENKIENKEKKKFNKKFLAFGVIGILALMVVSAALVYSYAQKQIDMSIQSPIILDGETQLTESVNLIAGDGYRVYLLEGTNQLNRDVNVNVYLKLLDGEVVVTNTTGFYLAYSEDIQYAYNLTYGNVDNWIDAQTWMNNNLDWFDWYLTDDLVNYNSSIITNYEGNSAYANAIDFNQNIPFTIGSGKFYAVIYLDIDEAVIPNNYTFSLEIKPTA
jgi:hypothetical protein